MSKVIPIALQAEFDKPATTRCRLLKIVTTGGDTYAFTTTNRPVDYDDGDGSLTYQVMSGFDHSAVVSTGDTSVDNAEARILLLPGTPFSEAQVLAGELDGASYSVYEIDYSNPSLGHRVVSHGYLGKPKIGKGGLSISVELRSLVDLLRQTPWEKWQIRCRVKRFGSQVGEERFPCKYDLSGEWVNGVSVTSVGVESDRTFTASGLMQAADYFAPGMIEWVTGDNAGLSFEVEAFASGGTITTAFGMPYPVQTGDTFNIRRDCTRNWSGHNSCETFNNRPNYRGEPHIKPADALAAQTPGAQVSPGSGGQTYQPDETAQQ